MTYPLQAIGQVSDTLWEAIGAVKPVMAAVSEFDPANPHMVRVGGDGQWYPATVASLPAGTAGVLLPLAGGNKLFIAIGQ
jgi:hypothetical protein